MTVTCLQLHLSSCQSAALTTPSSAVAPATVVFPVGSAIAALPARPNQISLLNHKPSGLRMGSRSTVRDGPPGEISYIFYFCKKGTGGVFYVVFQFCGASASDNCQSGSVPVSPVFDVLILCCASSWVLFPAAFDCTGFYSTTCCFYTYTGINGEKCLLVVILVHYCVNCV